MTKKTKMGQFSEYKILPDKNIKGDSLKIDFRKAKIQAELAVYTFQDNDTKQYVSIIPSLDITGYGATSEKAHKMLKFSLDDFYTFLVSASFHKVAAELKHLGWKRRLIKVREYSKSYVDINGALK